MVVCWRQWPGGLKRHMKKKLKESNKNSVGKRPSGVIYQCPKCGVTEIIPQDVIEYFDLVNPPDPLHGPHTFSCEKCNGIMFPKEKEA